MLKSSSTRVLALLALMAAALPWRAEAAAPDSCKFLTPAAVSAAIGKPVTGGTMSTVDHQGASASSCMYRAGLLMVIVSVDERGSAGAAMTEYHAQLTDSQSRDTDKEGASDAQKTVLVPGLGDGAFTGDLLNGSALDIVAVKGSQVFQIGIVGGSAALHAREISLMQAALGH